MFERVLLLTRSTVVSATACGCSLLGQCPKKPLLLPRTTLALNTAHKARMQSTAHVTVRKADSQSRRYTQASEQTNASGASCRLASPRLEVPLHIRKSCLPPVKATARVNSKRVCVRVQLWRCKYAAKQHTVSGTFGLIGSYAFRLLAKRKLLCHFVLLSCEESNF